MVVKSQKIECKDCGMELTEKDKKCPSCGSTRRRISVVVEEILNPHEKIEGKAKHKDGKKPFKEFVHGDDLHRKSGKWNHKNRIIDRENDEYVEVIKDKKTGEIIHKCEEPLSKHTGHGSDKKKKVD